MRRQKSSFASYQQNAAHSTHISDFEFLISEFSSPPAD